MNHETQWPDDAPTYGQLKIRLEQALETVESQRVMLFDLRGELEASKQPTAWPDDAPEWANELVTVYTSGEGLGFARAQRISTIERPKPAKQKCKCCGHEVEA